MVHWKSKLLCNYCFGTPGELVGAEVLSAKRIDQNEKFLLVIKRIKSTTRFALLHLPIFSIPISERKITLLVFPFRPKGKKKQRTERPRLASRRAWGSNFMLIARMGSELDFCSSSSLVLILTKRLKKSTWAKIVTGFLKNASTYNLNCKLWGTKGLFLTRYSSF